MDMEFLGDSSCVKAAGYEKGFLTVEFEDGSIYTYESVGPQTWSAFKRSTSKGFFFNRSIRKVYSYFEGQAPDSGELSYIDQKYFEEYSVD
jgi:hypothetical protein